MSDTLQKAEGFSSVLKDFDEATLDKVRKQAIAILSQDVDINAIASVLIASRQLYAAARFALHRDLAAEGHVWEDGLEEFIIKAMADKAEQPYTRTDLMRSLEGPTRKFLVGELQKEVEIERTEAMKTAASVDAVLKQRVLNIPGYSLDPGDTLVVVGTRKALQSFFDAAYEQAEGLLPHDTDTALVADNGLDTVVRVRFGLPLSRDITKVRDQTKYTVSSGLWAATAHSNANFERLMANVLSHTLARRCDLLLVDDVALAYASPFIMDADPHCKENVLGGIKALRKWVRDRDAILVAGIVVPPEAASGVGAVQAEYAERYKDVEGVYVISVPFEEVSE